MYEDDTSKTYSFKYLFDNNFELFKDLEQKSYYDNKEVTIAGYMLTLAPDEGVYVLSQNPYADCFFCGYGGPESAIELRLKPGHESFLMDELVTVTGRLELNRIDISSGVYIMHDATAIKN